MISLPTSIKQNKVNDNYTIFEIEAFYPGYGVTIGNALRRVLLSSLEGAAISEVKIKDVPHEFSTLSGVKEDVLHILLNLKQLRFKSFSNDPQTIILKVKGEKEVTGADFKLSSDIKLANPEQYIATLTDKKTELEIEVTIEKGFGYKGIDKEKKQDVGVMALDKIFTPIKKVNYHVENVRVGDRTDYDKLILEIETDGTIKPEEALHGAIKILEDHIDFLKIELGGEIVMEKVKTTAKKTAKKAKEITQNIKDIKISEKAINALVENGIETVEELIDNTEEALAAIKGIGKKGLKEINKVLDDLGLTLKK